MTAAHHIDDIATFHLSRDQVDLYREWTECVAFRFIDLPDGTVQFQTTNDLERITRPEAS